ncbi:hypothetical protein [Poseidonocella sp. HB161398]|uniref:hypothetical protein n=1 Tax=Poseidonocella sp. HB161398 TaxID=2320855 RepID=UPI0011083827|nr:hypothetical protein [Poseidonocella sp. HB161398]
MSRLLPALLLAAAAPAAQASELQGFANPESVLIAPGARYVSNLGAALAPLEKDGDGFVSLLDDDGKVLERRAFTGLDAPKGMALHDGRLYVADIDRVAVFDPESRAQIASLPLPAEGPALLNDIASDGTRLLVTDTLGGSLWALDPATQSFARLAGDMPGANGVAWESGKGRAVIVAVGAEFRGGRIYTWSPEDGAAPVPDSPRGLLDGIALLPDGRVLVSDWQSLDPPMPGRFLSVDPETGETRPAELSAAIAGPADFALDSGTGQLWIPAMPEGAVHVLPLPGR